MPGGAPNPRELGRFYALGQVGLEMAAPVALGAGIDHYFGWMPWCTIVGALVGLIGGMAHLILLMNQRDDKKK